MNGFLLSLHMLLIHVFTLLVYKRTLSYKKSPGLTGMEVAAYLADKAKSVSVVDIIKVPFQLALGDRVGAVLQKVHTQELCPLWLSILVMACLVLLSFPLCHFH